VPFRLNYGKPYHLPVELEHKTYWAIKFINFDLKAAGVKMLLQLNELKEIRFEAYGSSRIYNERMNRWHDKHIYRREFEVSDLLLLFHTRLKVFPVKLGLRWSGPLM